MGKVALRFVFSPLTLSLVLCAVTLQWAISTWWMNGMWVTNWPSASVAVQVASYAVAPLFAAVIAYSESRSHERGWQHGDATSSRALGTLTTVRLLVWMGVATIVVGASVAVTVTKTLPYVGGGSLQLSYALLYLCGLGYAIAFATVVGVIIRPSWLAAPLSAGVVFFTWTMTTDGRGATFNQLGAYPFEQLSTTKLWLLALGAVFALFTAVRCVIWLTSRSRNGYVTGHSTIPWGVALAGVGLMANMTGDIVVPRTSATPPVCVGEDFAVCVWEENSAYISDIEGLMSRGATLPGSWSLPSTELNERGLPNADETGFYLIEGSMWSITPAIALAIMESSSTVTIPDNMSDEELTRWSELHSNEALWLEARLIGTSTVRQSVAPPGVDINEMNRVLSLPDNLQAQWVNSIRQERVELQETDS